MGYACPVCEEPQRDGEHLANHAAFTAMLHGDEHEAWLDERVPGWEESTPTALAEALTARAEETEYEEVFEDTVARSATSSRGNPGDTVHDHGRDGGAAGGGRGAAGEFDVEAARQRGGGGELDAAAEESLREAREMTRRMREGDADEAEDADGTDGADE